MRIRPEPVVDGITPACKKITFYDVMYIGQLTVESGAMDASAVGGHIDLVSFEKNLASSEGKRIVTTTVLVIIDWYNSDGLLLLVFCGEITELFRENLSVVFTVI